MLMSNSEFAERSPLRSAPTSTAYGERVVNQARSPLNPPIHLPQEHQDGCPVLGPRRPLGNPLKRLACEFGSGCVAGGLSVVRFPWFKASCPSCCVCVQAREGNFEIVPILGV
jgi:hypothetical protein